VKEGWVGTRPQVLGWEGSQRKNPRYQIGIALNAIVIPYFNLLD
jgi:hypothetical protein